MRSKEFNDAFELSSIPSLILFSFLSLLGDIFWINFLENIFCDLNATLCLKKNLVKRPQTRLKSSKHGRITYEERKERVTIKRKSVSDDKWINKMSENNNISMMTRLLCASSESKTLFLLFLQYIFIIRFDTKKT